MNILGIESSCDETSVAVITDRGRILANIIASQQEHAVFGGVIPELASRVHLTTIVPIYKEALKVAGLSIDNIGLIAATLGPGLVGPLLVGLTSAKGLSFAKQIPFVPVNHLEGHLAANILEHKNLNKNHLALIISGGHTLLIKVKRFGDYELLGQTRDDAAGEAFDKVAKLLNLGYPGGAEIDKLAKEGDPEYIKFPRPMMHEGSYQFSFSGLKTAVSLHLKSLSAKELEKNKANIAASFQEAAVEVLVFKTLKAARENNIDHISVGGGVAANSRIKTMFEEKIKDDKNIKLFYPSLSLCTDNAAMIAAAGVYNYELYGKGEMIANAIPSLKLI